MRVHVDNGTQGVDGGLSTAGLTFSNGTRKLWNQPTLTGHDGGCEGWSPRQQPDSNVSSTSGESEAPRGERCERVRAQSSMQAALALPTFGLHTSDILPNISQANGPE